MSDAMTRRQFMRLTPIARARYAATLRWALKGFERLNNEAEFILRQPRHDISEVRAKLDALESALGVEVSK